MPSLTVTEKEHWKERIGRRIDRRVEALAASDPGLFDRVARQARERALRSLGLAEMQAELDAVAALEEQLESRAANAHRAMLAAVRRVPVEEAGDAYRHGPHPEVTRAVAKRQEAHEEELLAGDAIGRDVLRLRQEKERLLDVVWLATSPQQVKDLWRTVSELLGDEPTPLETAALAIGSAPAAG
jgi:hypothetical protein